MALIKCHECGHEISTEAKVCPQCGAKNINRKKTFTPTWGAVVIVTILALLIYDIYEVDLNPTIPTCESSHGKKVFVDLFEKSQYAQINKIQVTYVVDQIDVSDTSRPEDRICEVTFSLNNGTEKKYIFTFKPSDKGGYHARMEPKK